MYPNTSMHRKGRLGPAGPGWGTVVNITVDHSLSLRNAAGVPVALLGVAVACLLAACHRAPPPAAPPAVGVALPVHSDGSAGSAVVRHPAEGTARYSKSFSFRVPGKLI